METNIDTSKLKIESATLRISNAADSERSNEIAANVRIKEGTIEGVDSGTVTGLDGRQLVSFSSHGSGNTSYTFYGPESDHMALMQGIRDFIGAAGQLVAATPISTGE